MTFNSDTIKEQVIRHRNYFNSGKTKSAASRIENLKHLKKIIRENETQISQALKQDLNKSSEEAFMTEINETLREIEHAIKKTTKWMKPERTTTPLVQQPARSYIQPDPLGVVLIIGPWNYPFALLMSPLAAALAAGNCAILKPSEMAPNTSNIIGKLIRENFDPGLISAVEGGVNETTALLKEKFDHIFFTGGPAVGKIVMKAASNHLTPVTLELGGKSPCIVDNNIHLKYAAKRIAWGKYLNAGQTCVAPDYLLVNKKIKNALIEEIKKNVTSFFGTNPQESGSYGRIINEKHFHRVSSLIDTQKVVFGGTTTKDSLYIAPTLLDNVSPDDPIMSEEIFGPLLPVMTYENLTEALDFVNKRPKPLALYIFSQDKEIQQRVLTETSSGGACINDTIVHIASATLPFGGIGESGMGNYHGKAGFNTFSHKKSIMKRSTLIDMPLRYPPFKPILKRILKAI